MLKAVRFDLLEHKELIDFIEDYRDKKNKPNHSEAIRMLMKKGLDTINQHPIQQPKIDIESLKIDLKKELLDQIMSQINLTQQTSIQTPVHERAFTIVNEDAPEDIIEKEETIKSTPIPQNINPLLANLLNNSQR